MCWSKEHTLRNKNLDSLDNSGEESEQMQIVTAFDLFVHTIHVDQETPPFRAHSLIIVTPFISPSMHLAPANGAK